MLIFRIYWGCQIPGNWRRVSNETQSEPSTYLPIIDLLTTTLINMPTDDIANSQLSNFQADYGNKTITEIRACLDHSTKWLMIMTSATAERDQWSWSLSNATWWLRDTLQAACSSSPVYDSALQRFSQTVWWCDDIHDVNVMTAPHCIWNQCWNLGFLLKPCIFETYTLPTVIGCFKMRTNVYSIQMNGTNYVWHVHGHNH